DKAAAGDAVEFSHPRGKPWRVLALAGQRFQRELPALAFGADRDRDGGCAFLLDQRVPLTARLALALPAVIGRAAVLADKGEGGFGHWDSSRAALIARNAGRRSHFTARCRSAGLFRSLLQNANAGRGAGPELHSIVIFAIDTVLGDGIERAVGDSNPISARR